MCHLNVAYFDSVERVVLENVNKFEKLGRFIFSSNRLMCLFVNKNHNKKNRKNDVTIGLVC